mmetsp:Transcript_12341/g.23976  ORF Transcript_12341/g.23976 Transcript_12341/m.23976 type:complete len:290 (+) Transcript_12341:297-1166(+)
MSAALVLQASASWASLKLLRGRDDTSSSHSSLQISSSRNGRGQADFDISSVDVDIKSKTYLESEDETYHAFASTSVELNSIPLVGANGIVKNAAGEWSSSGPGFLRALEEGELSEKRIRRDKRTSTSIKSNKAVVLLSKERMASGSDMLKLWCCVALLRLYEATAEPLIKWVPGYGILKFSLCLYCSWSQSSSFIHSVFKDVLEPLFQRTERMSDLIQVTTMQKALELLYKVQENSWVARLADLSDADLVWWRTVLNEKLNQAKGSKPHRSKKLTLMDHSARRAPRPQI